MSDSYRVTAEVFAADESRDRGERASVAGLLAIADAVDKLRTDLLAAIERAEESDRTQRESERENPCPSHAFGYDCARPAGHPNSHMNKAALYGMPGQVFWKPESVAGQRHGDVPKFEDNSTTEVKTERSQRCGHFGPVTDRGAFGVRRPVCNRNPGHPGPHGTGIVGETWLR